MMRRKTEESVQNLSGAIAVSIVVPVYKVEPYLKRCVESLRSQSLRNIEIILVDDGSPDGCPALCDSYAQQDERIRVVHKQNGGLSSARNAGLRLATGSYVGFVDADDDVEPDMYEKLYALALREQVDMVMCDYLRILGNGTRREETANLRAGRFSKAEIQREIYPRLIVDEAALDYGPVLSVWRCLYRRSFLSAHGLEFDEEVRWSEDQIFSAQMCYLADSLYYAKGQILYHYWQNAGSITTSYLKGAWGVYMCMNRHLRAFFEGRPEYDFSRQLDLHVIYYACNLGNSLNGKNIPFQEKYKEYREVLHSKELATVLQSFRCSDQWSFKRKLRLWLMKHKMTRVLLKR